MRLLCDLFEQGGVDIVFSGHAHDYQRTFPLTFKAKRDCERLTVNPDGTVSGEFSFDKTYDGQTNNHPHGIIYLVSGGGANPVRVNQSKETRSFHRLSPSNSMGTIIPTLHVT